MLNIAAYFTDKFVKFERGSAVCIYFHHSVETIILALGAICAGGSVFTSEDTMPYTELLNSAQRIRSKYWFSKKQFFHFKERLETDIDINMKAIEKDKGENNFKSDNYLCLSDFF